MLKNLWYKEPDDDDDDTPTQHTCMDDGTNADNIEIRTGAFFFLFNENEILQSSSSSSSIEEFYFTYFFLMLFGNSIHSFKGKII